MRSYILKRLVNMILTFTGVMIIMYFIYVSLPGNYVDTLLGMPVKQRTQFEHILHLDESKTTQFRYWITGIMKGDFGISFSYETPVKNIVGPAFFNTFIMFFLSLICSLMISIPISLVSSIRAHSPTDIFWTIFAFIGISIPPFVFGAILTKLFTFNQFVFNMSIFRSISFAGYANLMNQHILPFVVLTFANIGIFVRYLRSSMIEIVHKDYMQTARAKGVSQKAVLYKHGLKNALIPVLTVLCTSLPGMISNILMIEIVFNYQGLGTLMINATHDRDYPLVMAFTMILAVAVLIANFLIDIIYRFIDPRIRIAK